MKKWICLLTALTLSLALVGCTGQKDSFRFICAKTDSPNEVSVLYEANLGDKVGGATVVAQLWQNGECIESTPLTCNNETRKIRISLFTVGNGTENSPNGLQVQIGTDEASGSVLTYFELPPNISGYSFAAYEEGETIHATPGEEILLGAMAFDTGTGVRTMDCKSLIDEPEKINGYSCILVIRAAFTADPIPPQAEAPAGKA